MEGEPITKKTLKSVQSIYLDATAQPRHYQYLFCRHIERLYGAPQVVFNGKSRCWSTWVKLSHTRRTRYAGGTFFPDGVPTSAQLIFGGHRQCIFQGIPTVNFTGSCKTTAFFFFFFTGAIKSYRKHISRAGGTLLVSLPKERRDHDVSETLKRSFQVVGSLVTGTRGPRLHS